MHKLVALGVLTVFFTVVAQAQVVITEVMYDPSGADKGREWVEVQNTSGNSINFTTWKFFEADANHGINHGIASTTIEHTTIEPQEFVVVTTDRIKFLTDFPSFSGKIFKSSFSSLNNTGEPLAFKNDVGVSGEQYLYDVAVGAAGDGNSLQKSTTGWIATVPTPGFATSNSGAQTTVTTTTSENNENTTTNTANPTVSGSGSSFNEPQLFGTIITQPVIFANAETTLQAHAFISGGKKAIDPVFTWNFGDGTIGYGSQTTHRYKYTGTYHVVLNVVASVDTVTTFALEHSSLVVVAPDISVFEGNDEQGGTYVRIENKSKSLLDVSSWVVRRGDYPSEYYVLPKNSFIAPLTALRISQEITRFKNDVGLKTIEVLFPNMITVAQYNPLILKTNTISSTSSAQIAPIQTSKTYAISPAQPKPKALIAKTSNSSLVVDSQKESQTSALSGQSAEGEYSLSSSTPESVLTAAVTASGEGGTSVLWYVLPLLLLTIATGMFLGTKKEGSTSDEYTIIDDGK